MSSIAQLAQGPIEYRVVGQGAPVLVLNGGHTNCDSPFGHERFFLDHGYQLIIPSRPGYGRTPSSTGQSADAFADALVGLLDALHLERVIVVGISAAGPTALQLAQRHPERVSKMILQNAVLSGDFASRSIQIGAHVVFNRYVERWTWTAFRAFGCAAPLTALKIMIGSLSSLDPAQVVAGMTPEQQQGALKMLLASRSGAGFLHDLKHRSGDLTKITAPTLIITSQYDGSVDASHGNYMAANIPNAEHFISPAESHLMWYSAHNAAIEAKMLAYL